MSDHCVHCDPLCRGNDKNPHGCGTAMWDQGECVGCRERAAIVAWLLGNGLLHIAYTIESGEPLAGNDE